MRKDITITAEPRDTRGKNEARRLRVRGMAPAVVYGTGAEPVAVAVSPKEVSKHSEEHLGPQHDLQRRHERSDIAGHDR